MNRDKFIEKMQETPLWDVLIIGGGATGLGSALDAAARGYRTLLLEQSDFAKGTSSRSTKLIHGGLRYLQQGNISLVTEALYERGLLCKNAPHLIHHLPFLVPNYHFWEGPFYGVGLKIYDLLAGELGIESSKHLSKEETLKQIPNLVAKDLKGGVVYYDGQFDDARLAINLAHTASDEGACLLNYMKVTSFIKKEKKIVGVRVKDIEKNISYRIYAKAIINATGVFSDFLRKVDDPKAKSMIFPSQGVHIVLDKSFQRGKVAILVPKTEDKRVLFMVPWHDRVLVGTTDTSTDKAVLEPKALKEEIEFLLHHAGIYLSKKPKASDILSVFAGLRPLVKEESKKSTASTSRDHTIKVSSSKLITIAGGKWTTYRKMAEDVIDIAINMGKLPHRPCNTEKLKLHGWKKGLDPLKHFSTYGSDIKEIRALMRERKSLAKKMHKNLPYYFVEVVWAIQKEMALTLEDVLSRRTRCLLLDVRATLEIAPKVASLMAKELKQNKTWEKTQLKLFQKCAKNYLP